MPTLQISPLYLKTVLKMAIFLSSSILDCPKPKSLTNPNSSILTVLNFLGTKSIFLSFTYNMGFFSKSNINIFENYIKSWHY